MLSTRAIAIALTLAATATVAAAQQRPLRADPYHAYLVAGRVLGPGDAPIAGVVVERVTGPRDARPYSRGAYREVSSGDGGFRFAFRGLGLSTGRTWYLAVRRPGCPVEIRTVTLRREIVPGTGREGDVATGVVLRVPAC